MTGAASAASEVRTLGAVRALIADYVRNSLGASQAGGAQANQPGDLPVGLRIDVGLDLVPSDTKEKPDQWPLVSVLIPQMRERLQQQLGYPVQGVRITDDASLPPTGYVVKLDGRASARGVVDVGRVPHPAVPRSQYPSQEPWTGPVAALEAAISSAPDHCLTPEALDSLLNQWATKDGPQSDFVPRFDAKHLDLRIQLWRALRAMVKRDGRIAAWEDGLGELVASLTDDTGREPGAGPEQDQPCGSQAGS